MKLKDMPHMDGYGQILERGSKKYGSRWLEDEEGRWWGAKDLADMIFQVRKEPPDFPTRTWSFTTGGSFTPINGCRSG